MVKSKMILNLYYFNNNIVKESDRFLVSYQLMSWLHYTVYNLYYFLQQIPLKVKTGTPLQL